ncbi:transketolase [Roseospira navarrensis]|uniref:Transketolase n=1 Tax=Roseospira navarrensis TaxID=140058 RepID=A0A7X2D6E1_9PROT|nr:transketolase [Roseospira navarrensis]MQX38200.1 transketolase [Roseospira navarrensis]
MNHPDLDRMAAFMRRKILDVSFGCGLTAHLGGGLSMVDVMAVLYGRVLRLDPNNPRWEDRDRFILSKGHGVLGFYPALLAAGIISEEVFNTFQADGSDLIAHPVMNLDLGIESSNGSLGHGLSMAIGIALAARKKDKAFKTYVLLGDGECNEGAVWEAVMLAAQLGLDGLTAVIDHNKLQSDGESRDILQVRNMAARFAAFGWHAVDVDGHDIDALVAAFEAPAPAGLPRVLVAHTIKGKGVPFMENDNAWHHKRLTKADHEAALAALGETVAAEGAS